ncbi:Stk1 family PASTA domain-containing Ser/Thr kinase [Micromonospora sp. NBC_01796]|uniref:Stk1 family PASTA domain-containing Ser/Thr kinase n=1 Tax=Micromonospora sp. NBC_01796 TaxID=2975987 RepID=UPI002DDB4CEA|nr:Stk1 family PASTA domain-containing Ser/Thr kinase [Micromonospora sp. NBC_01796]WSA88645.1 Stk1 family PASTA domain-containing Ser/Thr kinase [Micromonospora sp. NBC_01796]
MTAQARLLGGRYQVGELLGYGGMAEVHRGRDLRLGRDVAIKMLRTDLARDATFQMRFRREAQNAASLNHPAIVAVYDTGEEIAPTGETLPFIVMEFVNGRTLKEVLAAEGRLMPRRALEISADICAALEFSHRHGIIHRDIKPGNVMLTLNGQVKVMDFGIARALASGATTMTQTSAVIGTAQYLSPEQARGEPVDARSDVYAAGCVIFELLCGHPPFVGDSPVSVAYQHVREDPPAPSDINRDVTPPIDAIVLKALSKNPLNRYQSAGEMRADLLRAAAGRPVMATPVLRDDETTALPPAGAVRPGGGGPRPAPARVGDPRNRRASAWVLATLSGLGVLAVIALVAALLINNADKPTTVQVQGVVGQTEAAAVAALQKQGFKTTVGAQEFNDTCEKDTVASQDPAAGQSAEANTTITLRLCGGPEAVKVPANQVGNPYANVEAALKQAGLVPERKNVSSEQQEGTVLKLTPGSDASVQKGSKVVVEVATGNLKTVPEVRGETREDAENTLDNLGFDVKVIDGNKVAPQDAGRVEKQSIPEGQKKPVGTQIVLTVTVPRQEPTANPTTPTPTPTGTGGAGAGGGGGVPVSPSTTPSARPTRSGIR